MNKKLISLVMSVLLIFALLAGCSGSDAATTETSADDVTTTTTEAAENGDDGSSDDTEEVTLSFALWDNNQAIGLRTMFDEFEAANPGIKVEIQVNGWADYWTMLEAGATGGSLPDVFWMHSNEIYRYASNDMLYDLTSLIESNDVVDLAKFPEGLNQIYNFEGSQYAVPKDFDTIGLWYNKTLFDQAELDYPDDTWTWEDLYNAAEALTTDDVYGILTPFHNQEGYYNFVYQNGGTIITDDKASGYDDPKTIEAMEYYVQFIRDGLSPEIYGDAERAEALQNGLCAMGFFGSWNLSGFTDNEFMAENFDVAVLPQGAERASIFNGLGHAIAHNTENVEEAWKLVEYLSSKEGQERHAELGIAISAYEGAADLWVSSNDTYDVKAFIDMVDYAVIRPYSNTTAVWEDKAYEALRPAFTGEKSVEEACQEAAAVMNESLATE